MKRLQHPVPVEVLTALGDVMVSFSLLEGTIQDFVGSLVDGGLRVGHIVTSELQFPRLLTLARALYIERRGEDPDFSAFNRLLQRAEKMYSERNLVIHSFWAAGTAFDSVTRIKLTARDKSGLTVTFKEVAVGAVRDQAERTQILAHDFLMFWIHLIEVGKP